MTSLIAPRCNQLNAWKCAPISSSNHPPPAQILLHYDPCRNPFLCPSAPLLPQDFLTPTTKFETEAVGDANMRSLQKGDVIQLERKGYYIVDQPLTKPGGQVVLFNIPDGRAKSVGTTKPQ